MQRKTPRKASLGGERRKRRFEERDRRIRQEAVRLFLERGLQGFSMDDVATAIEYSKGTVYLHYVSKEDVLVAVLVDHLAVAIRLFERAAASPICTRARMRALVELEVARAVRFPEVLPLSTTFLTPESLAKAKPERGQAVGAAYDRLSAVEAGIVREAVSRADLVLPPERRIDWVLFPLAAVSFGSMYLAAQGRKSRQVPVETLRPRIFANFEIVLDGLGWKPVGGGAAYDADVATLEKLLDEPLPDTPPDVA